MNDRNPETNQYQWQGDAEELFRAFARLRAGTTLGPDITIKELGEAGRR